MRAASLSGPAIPRRSRRLLALAGDERLVDGIARGDEAAFEVAFERHGPAILSFCRHMLGSPEEAEDAVQYTFAAAYRDLQRPGDRQIALKPWLFTIARNRCITVLRARREHPLESVEVATTGLAEQVEERAELRRLLADVRELPDEQRAALLLTELGDLSHAEVAGVLGCEVPRVKALVYRARSALIAQREARATPCGEIREQLANLSGGSLRRSGLKLHLRECSGCRDYRERIRQQRRMLAASLPVVPAAGLKSSVLAAVGLGGGAAGGGGAIAGGIGGALAGLGGSGAAKLAAVGVLASAGAVGGAAVVTERGGTPEAAAPTPAQDVRSAPAEGSATAGGSAARVRGGAPDERLAGRPRRSEAAPGAGEPPRRGERAQGQAGAGNGGPPSEVPVRRGPPAKPSPQEPVRRGPPAKAAPEAKSTPKVKAAPVAPPEPPSVPKPVTPPRPPKPAPPAPPVDTPPVESPPAAPPAEAPPQRLQELPAPPTP